MKKTILMLATIALIGFNNISTAQTPNWAWAKSVGNTSSDQGRSVATDASGNVFMTGYFAGSTITFGTTTLTSAGSGDVFIVKYDANGNVLWAKSAGGNDYDLGNSITTDASGNVFITGMFESDTITFGTTVLTNADNTGLYEDIFIAKYDTNGNLLWAKSAGGAAADVSNSVATDTNGNVFITGYFHSPAITFGSTTLTNTTALYEDVFIVKYDTSGNVIWAKSSGSSNSSSPSDRGQSVATDTSGNVFMTGYFEGATITFGSNTLTNTSADFGDVFIVKYDANGNVLWSKSVGSISDDLGYSVATDTSGNVFISGYFKGFSITFGTITLANVNQSFIFTKENFIAKYNAAGNFLWARSASGTSDDYSRGITTDTAGNAYMIGNFFSPTITFESTTLTKAGPLSQDIFMVKYDPSGNVDWAESIGNIGNESGLGIATDTNNNIYLTGSFSAPSISFGITNLTNVGSIDVFIAKVDSAILSTGIEQETDYSSIVIAPNPFTSQTTISFKEEQQNTTIKIIDMLGKEIKSINFNGKQFILEKGEMQQGIYIVHAMDENKKVMSRKIIIR